MYLVGTTCRGLAGWIPNGGTAGAQDNRNGKSRPPPRRWRVELVIETDTATGIDGRGFHIYIYYRETYFSSFPSRVCTCPDTALSPRRNHDRRAKIIEADQHCLQGYQNKRGPRPRKFPTGDEASPSTGGILPRIRPSKHESDLDSVRSTPPPPTRLDLKYLGMLSTRSTSLHFTHV